jgi:hypothetical protein
LSVQELAVRLAYTGLLGSLRLQQAVMLFLKLFLKFSDMKP